MRAHTEQEQSVRYVAFTDATRHWRVGAYRCHVTIVGKVAFVRRTLDHAIAHVVPADMVFETRAEALAYIAGTGKRFWIVGHERVRDPAIAAAGVRIPRIVDGYVRFSVRTAAYANHAVYAPVVLDAKTKKVVEFVDDSCTQPVFFTPEKRKEARAYHKQLRDIAIAEWKEKLVKAKENLARLTKKGPVTT